MVAWYEQGLPPAIEPGTAGEQASEHFGMDPWPIDAGIHVGLHPPFETRVIEDRGDHEIVQQADGVRVLRRKFASSIPMHQAHLLVDRNSWQRHYRPRLNPDDGQRFPDDRAEHVRRWCDPERAVPLCLNGASLWGFLRNWMGLEAVSYVVYDDPAWFEEMVTTLADCTVGLFEKLLKTGGRFDGASFWEDMCYNGGPLIAPHHFRRFLLPQYRRITDLLHAHGVDIVWVDCDGKIDELVPLWLEAGVNTMFPVEIGTWRCDPIAMRQKYGRELRLMGGFDKRILAQSPTAIGLEVDRLTPLVEEGGFIPFCDHRVPPDVPLHHYLHYLHAARARWGQGVNLKPMGILPPPAPCAS